MVKFWMNRIRIGKATIENVPDQWREEVREALKREEVMK